MITVVATMHFRPEALDQALPILHRLVETTRQEAGCHRYDLYKNPAVPGEYTMIEEWADQAAMDAHGANPNFRTAVAGLGPLASAPSQLVKLEKEQK
jgi:quinol monooxygenase YgiN